MIVPVVMGVGAYALATQPRVRRHELTLGTTGSSTEACSETTLSAEEIYDRLRAGAQHAAMQDARAEVRQLTRNYVARLAEVKLLTSQLAGNWNGDAADGAVRYSRPAAEVLESSGEQLGESARDHGPLDRQAEAYARALDTVVKLPAKPQSDLLNTFIPFDTDTDRAIRKYNNDAARNIAAYADYYAASGENGRAMPYQFPVPPSGSAPTIVVVPAHGDAGAGPRSNQVPAPAAATDSGSPPTVSASAGIPTPGSSTGVAPVYDAPGGTAPQSRPADVARAAPNGPAPAAAPVSGGGAVSGALDPFSWQGEGGGARRRGGLAGPGRGLESGPRGQGGAESRSRAGVAGTAGTERGGAVGGGAPGTRRGKDSDEDKEHRTKYLQKEDLGKQWGPTEPFAPPVIGERK